VQGGLTLQNFTKTPYLWCFIYQFGGRGALFGGLSPPKSSRRNGTASISSRNRVLKIVEYSPSCSLMEYCYSSFSLRQEIFIILGQNIVFLTPWLTFLWQCKEIGTTNLSWRLASADKSITEPTRESYVCSHSSTRPNATLAIVFTGHCSYFVYTFPPALKLFVSILHSYAEKKQSYLKCNGGSDDTRHIPLLRES